MRRAAARRVYVEETLRREGRFGAALDRAAGDLQRMLGLGVKEAGEVREDIVSKTYRRAPAARRRAHSPCPVRNSLPPSAVPERSAGATERLTCLPLSCSAKAQLAAEQGACPAGGVSRSGLLRVIATHACTIALQERQSG